MLNVQYDSMLSLLGRCRSGLELKDMQDLQAYCADYEPFKSLDAQQSFNDRIAYAYAKGSFRLDLHDDVERLIAFLLAEPDLSDPKLILRRIYVAMICVYAAVEGGVSAGLLRPMALHLVNATSQMEDMATMCEASCFLTTLISYGHTWAQTWLGIAASIVSIDVLLVQTTLLSQDRSRGIVAVPDHVEWVQVLSQWRTELTRRLEG